MIENVSTAGSCSCAAKCASFLAVLPGDADKVEPDARDSVEKSVQMGLVLDRPDDDVVPSCHSICIPSKTVE
jgi:hypothetical protein